MQKPWSLFVKMEELTFPGPRRRSYRTAWFYYSSLNIYINYAPRSANSVAHLIASRPTGDSTSWTRYGSPP
ncbi:hypothetical protein GIB67_003208 [Kingdonia uniflora]|uniref:Uncharacterized protein n=1 Tax=Kingdonia uniflora TaxID=39325 RepID=A0A7J7LGS6_9MAGN|nr:hypothetical protein GIB67_003208 [Kingdonia uniflora]